MPTSPEALRNYLNEIEDTVLSPTVRTTPAHRLRSRDVSGPRQESPASAAASPAVDTAAQDLHGLQIVELRQAVKDQQRQMANLTDMLTALMTS